MEGGRDCIKRQILLAKWEKYESEYEDCDSPVTYRLGKFTNRHDLAEKSYFSL